MDASAEAITNAANARFLPLAGGVLSGPLLLIGDPTEPLGAANKHYVDDQISQVAGITEAPQDGSVYGRYNRTWARALPISGGTLTGDLSVGGAIQSNAQDGIVLVAPEGTAARYTAHLVNDRIWTFGAVSQGFAITDENVPAWRMLIEPGGNIRLLGGAVIGDNGIYGLGGTTFGFFQSDVWRIFQWSASWWDGWNIQDGTRVWQVPGGTAMSLGGDGSLWVLGNITTGASVSAGRLSTPTGEITNLTVWGNAVVNGTLYAGAVNTGTLTGLWDLAVGGTMTAQWATIHGSINATIIRATASP